MKKKLTGIIFCLVAFAFTDSQAKPMTLDEYRKCREAIYHHYSELGVDFSLRDTFYKGNVILVLKEQVAGICDTLGFAINQFNRAHKRYGLMGLTYEQEIRNLVDLWFYNPSFLIPISDIEVIRDLNVDLGLEWSRTLSVDTDGISFDGFKVELDSLPGVLARYNWISKRSMMIMDKFKEWREKYVKEQGGVLVGDDPENKGYKIYAFTLPPIIYFDAGPGVTCSHVWPVIYTLLNERIDYLVISSSLDKLNWMNMGLALTTPPEFTRMIDKGYYTGYVIPGPLIVTPAGDTQSLENSACFLKSKMEDRNIDLVLTAKADLLFSTLVIAMDSLQYFYLEEIDYSFLCLATPDVYELYKSKSLPWPDSAKEK